MHALSCRSSSAQLITEQQRVTRRWVDESPFWYLCYSFRLLPPLDVSSRSLFPVEFIVVISSVCLTFSSPLYLLFTDILLSLRITYISHVYQRPPPLTSSHMPRTRLEPYELPIIDQIKEGILLRLYSVRLTGVFCRTFSIRCERTASSYRVS